MMVLSNESIETKVTFLKEQQMTETTTPLRIGLIGAGNISAAYLRAARFFGQMQIVVCADLNQVPDPNTFGGPVRHLGKDGKWRDVALTHGFGDQNYRGLGAAEMASALALGVAHRASEVLALHVLEVMEAIVKGGSTGERIAIQSTVERPRALNPISLLGELN